SISALTISAPGAGELEEPARMSRRGAIPNRFAARCHRLELLDRGSGDLDLTCGKRDGDARDQQVGAVLAEPGRSRLEEEAFERPKRGARIALGEKEKRETGLRIPTELERLLEGDHGAIEIAAPPTDLAELGPRKDGVGGKRGRDLPRRCLALGLGGGEVAADAEDLRAMHAAHAGEVVDSRARHPARGGVGPLFGALPFAAAPRGPDRAAEDHAG